VVCLRTRAPPLLTSLLVVDTLLHRRRCRRRRRRRPAAKVNLVLCLFHYHCPLRRRRRCQSPAAGGVEGPIAHGSTAALAPANAQAVMRAARSALAGVESGELSTL
jgi:hypothetical protein